jgi:hypothetical protein
MLKPGYTLQDGSILNLEKGFYISNGENKRKKKFTPSIYLKEYVQKKRYFLYLYYIEVLKQRETDKFITQSIEIMVLESKCGQCVLEPHVFFQSQNDILYAILNYKYSIEKHIFMVGDDFSSCKIFVYSETNKNYKIRTKGEFVKDLSKKVKKLYKGVTPPSCGSHSFYYSFQQYLFTSLNISSPTLLQKMPLGVSFLNGFALINTNTNVTELIDLSPSVLTTQKPINDSYALPKFEETPEDMKKAVDQLIHNVLTGGIVISHATRIFLENLTLGDEYNYNAFRGFLYSLITAAKEGKNFQRAFWLSGPPGCSKSLFAALCRLLVEEAFVKEFKRVINQFSAGQIKDARLILISDLNTVTPQLIQLLKQILGRDTLDSEKKNVQETSAINSYAQVLIPSNKRPTDFSLIREDEALLEKIVEVHYPSYASIPPHLQVANFQDHFHVFMKDIFNWAIHAPKSCLNMHVRGKIFRQIAADKISSNIMGLEGFLKECLCFQPDSFMLIDDVQKAMRSYVETTKDDSIKCYYEGKISNADVGAAIQNLCRKAFDEEVLYMRSSKIIKDKNRPYGLKNLSLIQPNGLFPGQRSFSKKISKMYSLPPAFYSEQKIAWIGIAEYNTKAIVENQEAIKEARELAMQSHKDQNLLPLSTTNSLVETNKQELVSSETSTVLSSTSLDDDEKVERLKRVDDLELARQNIHTGFTDSDHDSRARNMWVHSLSAFKLEREDDTAIRYEYMKNFTLMDSIPDGHGTFYYPFFIPPYESYVFDGTRTWELSETFYCVIDCLSTITSMVPKPFESYISSSRQKNIMESTFEKRKAALIASKALKNNLIQESEITLEFMQKLLNTTKLEKKTQKTYYEKKQQFLSFCAPGYAESKDGGLVAKVGYLTSVTADHLDLILQETVNTDLKDFIFLFIKIKDMHILTASTLLENPNSLFSQIISEEHFWTKKAAEIMFSLKAIPNIKINFDSTKLIELLKMILYTSLTGHNPFYSKVMCCILKNGVPDLYSQLGADYSQISKSLELKRITAALQKFDIESETNAIGLKHCYKKSKNYRLITPFDNGYSLIHHPSIAPPYILKSFHAFFQAILTRSIVWTGGLPISWRDEGIIVMYPKAVNQKEVLDVTSEFLSDWSTKILKGATLKTSIEKMWVAPTE